MARPWSAAIRFAHHRRRGHPLGLPPAALVVLAAEFISTVGSGMTFPYLVVYLHEIGGMSDGEVGSALVIRALAAVLGAVAGGALCDRFGPARTTVGVAAIAASAAVLMAGNHTSALQGVAGAIVSTAAGAALVPALDTLLAVAAPTGARNKAFSWRNTCVNLGAMAGVTGASITLEVLGVRAGLRWVYLADAASYLLLAVLIKRVASRYRAGGRAPRPPLPDPARSDAVKAPGYGAVVRDPAMRRLFVLVLLIVAAGFTQFQVGLSTVTFETHQVNVLGWIFAVNMLVIAALQVPAQRILVDFPHAHVLAGAVVCMSLAWAVVAATPVPGALSLFLAAALFALGEVAYTPVMATLVNDLAPSGLGGRYNGAHALAWTVGFAVGAAATGTLLGGSSGQLFFAASALVLGLAALGALRLGRLGNFPGPAHGERPH
ncbi:MFS transporter [Streptomyces sp. NPDC097617]|uniref:MFS transporter n=1 Tax=Streptomyces sp. NPDC097617 TaxID=3366091 RepID=UPI0038035D6B